MLTPKQKQTYLKLIAKNRRLKIPDAETGRQIGRSRQYIYWLAGPKRAA
jgi:hypothetical protein